jgi:aminoglycoside phosphotransferase (APT) family kinase protein
MSDIGAHAQLGNPGTDDVRQRLEAFLRKQEGQATVTEWKPLQGGRSAETIKIGVHTAAGDRTCVLHVEPVDGPLAGISKAAHQMALLRVLEGTDIPAPRALWGSADPDVLGRPFLVTDFLEGDVPTVWRAEGRQFISAHPPGGELARSFVEVMARIHAVPVTSLPTEVRGGDMAAARAFPELERLRWSDAVAGSPFSEDPVLVYADCWLRTNTPSPDRLGLVHGDYRIGNLVIAGEAVVGVLDWELSEAGDPLYDLGTLCSPALSSNGLASGLWDPDDMVSCYESITGTPVDRVALNYYRVLATFKVAALWAHAAGSFAHGVNDIASLRSGHSTVATRAMLAQVLDLEAADSTPDRSSAVRAAETLAAVVRDVMGRVDGDDRERLGSVLAVLREQARVQTPPEHDTFQKSLAELARDAGVEPLVEDGTWTLAQLIPRLFADREIAKDFDHPLHSRLRALVSLAAVPTTGDWP